jgi:hypothetical protein
MTKEEYSMNTVADDLTHKARPLPRQKIYHSFPNNPVNLIINDRCINSNYPRVVSSAFHSIALREYFINKHG